MPKSDKTEKKTPASGGFKPPKTTVSVLSTNPNKEMPKTAVPPGETLIIVAQSDQTISYVVHRPIGVTSLDSKDWVLSPRNDKIFLEKSAKPTLTSGAETQIHTAILRQLEANGRIRRTSDDQYELFVGVKGTDDAWHKLGIKSLFHPTESLRNERSGLVGKRLQIVAQLKAQLMEKYFELERATCTYPNGQEQIAVAHGETQPDLLKTIVNRLHGHGFSHPLPSDEPEEEEEEDDPAWLKMPGVKRLFGPVKNSSQAEEQDGPSEISEGPPVLPEAIPGAKSDRPQVSGKGKKK